ncbi:mobile element protein [Limimaricola cinnabarinus LL-001]|uniref:Mobile element protein n=1 Tax=Limimaricola cinnabarinus LL-001 TaxID=1337093 RepID=U2Z7F1_9RHOB|nr:mobile element protein [Limimaricola cinnabarinus LL-001]
MPDEMWTVVAPLLPEEPPKPNGGRPRVPDREALRGIVFVLRTGMPWEMLPREVFGCSGMTCWRRLRDWQQAGVWDRLHRVLLERLDRAGELDWSRASLDAASIGAKRMARPGCKRRLGDGVISLHKRIRHVGSSAAAKMEIRASRSS